MTLPHTSYFEPLDDVVECAGCHGIGPAELATEVPGTEDAWACPACAKSLVPVDLSAPPCEPSACSACPAAGACHPENL